MALSSVISNFSASNNIMNVNGSAQNLHGNMNSIHEDYDFDDDNSLDYDDDDKAFYEQDSDEGKLFASALSSKLLTTSDI